MMTDIGTAKAQYYAPLLPLIGTRLQSRRVAVVGFGAVAGAAERLADCRVLRWQLCDPAGLGAYHPLARLWGRGPGAATASEAFMRALRTRIPWEDGWEFDEAPALTEQTYPELRRDLAENRPDLLLGGGDETTLRLLSCLARDLDLPAVLLALPAASPARSAVLALLPGDSGHGRDVDDLLRLLGRPRLLNLATTYLPPEYWFNWQEANASAAAIARALLLQGSSYAPPDLSRLLLDEHRTALVQGAPGWPWLMQYVDLARMRPAARPVALAPAPNGPQLAAGPLLIIGCGSLGSHAARTLVAAGAVRELVLVDGASVDPADLTCQFYTAADVGRNRAESLARALAALVPATGPGGEWALAAFDEHGRGLRRTRGEWAFTQISRHAQPGRWLDHLLATVRPAAVILAIDSAGDEDLARALRERGVPHVLGRCDAHAACFEVVVVDGARGRCLGCLRDAIFRAPDHTAATVIETGRAADLLARVAWQLSLPAGARAPWFSRLLAEGRTALIGGNGSVGSRLALTRSESLDRSYGIAVPGQVVAHGPDPDSLPCVECAFVGPALAAV